MSTLAQLAEQFRASRPAPPSPYTYPSLTRPTYADQGFSLRDVGSEGGSRQPIPVRQVTVMGLITTYRYTAVFGFRFRWPRGAPPAMSLFAMINPTKPGKPAVGKEGKREFDPYPDYAFKVQIEGITKDALSAHFQKFDGFDMEIEAIEWKAGEDAHVHKRPGVPKYSNIKLSKGIIDNRALWDWCQDTANGKLKRCNVTISVLKETRDEKEPLVSYDFIGCWPTKWSGLRLDGKGNGTLVEDLELAVDYVKLAK